MTTKQLHSILTTPISKTSYLTYFDFTINIFKNQNHQFTDEEEIEDLYQFILKTYNSIQIISQETGEILFEEHITPNLILPKFEESIQIDFQKTTGGDNPPKKSDVPDMEKVLEKLEWEESLCYEFDGFFCSDESCTYKHNGIMMHKAPFDGVWASHAAKIVFAEFRNIDGTLTDQFYDSCNDFNEWFLAKASRNEKFYVYVLDDEGVKFQRCGNMDIGFGKKKEDFHRFKFQQKITGEWEVVE